LQKRVFETIKLEEKMKRSLVCVGLCVLLSAAALWAGGQGASSDAGSGAKKIEFTLATVEAPSTPSSRALQAIADRLNATGRWEARCMFSGSLAPDGDAIVTQALMGVPTWAGSDPSRLATQFNIPDINILMAPYVLTDPLVLEKLPDTAIFKEWSAQLEKQGLTWIGNAYNGMRSFYTVDKPVRHVQDVKGLRIRSFNNNLGNALAKYLGFANIALTWGEILPGLQQKTIDGTEAQVLSSYTSALYEGCKYLALTKHFMLQSCGLVATKWLNSLPPQDRELILTVGKEEMANQTRVAMEEEDVYYQKMREKGVIISEVDMKEWMDAIAPLYTNNDLGFTPGLRDRLFRELGVTN
jgi:TRAP-type C4-dicarboxylate transport system substrate-binding protein